MPRSFACPQQQQRDANMSKNKDKQRQELLAALDEVLTCGVSRAELAAHVPALLTALDAYPPLLISERTQDRIFTAVLLAMAFTCFFLAAILGVVLAPLFGFHDASIYLETAWESAAEHWLAWRDLDPFSERCVISTEDVTKSYMDLFRPPQDCSFCRNISSVARVADISPAQFEQLYAYTAIPVIITDAISNWTATKTFSFAFFQSLYAKESPALTSHLQDKNCQFFPYKSQFKSLAEAFRMPLEQAEMRKGAQPWYIGWSNCDSLAAAVLRKYYSRPYFLPTHAESSKTDWIFMGTPGYGAHMHVDNVKNPSWQAQIRGTKKWTLIPPLECMYSCPSSISFTVSSGEVLVLDTNVWYHATSIEPGDISITIGSEFD